MKFAQIALIILLSFTVAFVTSHTTTLDHGIITAVTKESAYDKVMRTNTLRCAYMIYPPETIKDPNTGQLSGVVVDLTNEVGKQMGWNVEWKNEVGFADMFEGLKAGRYDAICAGLWENPARSKQALFTIPVDYGVFYAYVRPDDHRFDAGLDAANSKDVTIAVIDGEYGDYVAKESFSAAQTYRLPQLSDASQILLSVATRKADMAFFQKGSARGFLDNNVGKLKALDDFPVRVMPAPMVAVAPEEQRLKNVLDAGFRFLLNNGTVEKTLRKYTPSLDSYDLIAKPYVQP